MAQVPQTPPPSSRWTVRRLFPRAPKLTRRKQPPKIAAAAPGDRSHSRAPRRGASFNNRRRRLHCWTLARALPLVEARVSNSPKRGEPKSARRRTTWATFVVQTEWRSPWPRRQRRRTPHGANRRRVPLWSQPLFDKTIRGPIADRLQIARHAQARQDGPRRSRRFCADCRRVGDGDAAKGCRSHPHRAGRSTICRRIPRCNFFFRRPSARKSFSVLFAAARRLKVIGAHIELSVFAGEKEERRRAAPRLKCSPCARRLGAPGGRTPCALRHISSKQRRKTTLWSRPLRPQPRRHVCGGKTKFPKRSPVPCTETFPRASSTKAIDPVAYDLYLRGSIKSYAPDELRAKRRAVGDRNPGARPTSAEAWGRLAYVRTWGALSISRSRSVARVCRLGDARSGTGPLALDPPKTSTP